MEQPKIRCVKCRCEISGAHYNTPIGRYCIKCWEKVPARKKKMMEQLAMERLTDSGRFFEQRLNRL